MEDGIPWSKPNPTVSAVFRAVSGKGSDRKPESEEDGTPLFPLSSIIDFRARRELGGVRGEKGKG